MRKLVKTGGRIWHTHNGHQPEWYGKAGGYAIQGMAAKFVKRIDGDYYNVVGLPISLLRRMLKEFGVEIE
ncbi:MAG: Maf family protein [Lentisphaeria bacterium]|nr:Maf family protein [Lentisphaeria bacterium]